MSESLSDLGMTFPLDGWGDDIDNHSSKINDGYGDTDANNGTISDGFGDTYKYDPQTYDQDDGSTVFRGLE